jgi:HlyD family secretion protein
VPGASDGGCAGSACFHVLSPINGRVLRVLEESQRIVPAGLPLLVVGDPSRLEIVVDVLSTDAVRIRPGATLFVEDWGGEQALEARVRRVEPSGFTKTSALGVEEQRVNVIADLLEPAPGLGDGYRVEARIVVWEADNVLRVPASALFRQGQRWSVFVLDAGRARLRAVDVGERGTLQVQVLGGLSEGERVVVHPSDRVADGVRVEAAPVDPRS